MNTETMQEIDAFLNDSDTPPVDDDGFFIDRFIPEDRMESECIHDDGTYVFAIHNNRLSAVFECSECGKAIHNVR